MFKIKRIQIDDIEKIDMVASLYNEDLKLVRDKNLFQKVVFPRYTIGDNFRGPAGGLFISAIDLAKIMQICISRSPQALFPHIHSQLAHAQHTDD
mgnify:FL=1